MTAKPASPNSNAPFADMPSQRSADKAQIGAYVPADFKDAMIAAAARKLLHQ